MTTHKVTLYNAQAGHSAWVDLWGQCKALLMAGHRLHVTVRPLTRSLEQNDKFHALCSDIAKSGVKWMGKERNAKEWKVLLVSGHAIAEGRDAEIIPGLEGEFINIRESTAQMSVRRSSSLIEYTLAWCAQNGVRLPADGRDWPEELTA